MSKKHKPKKSAAPSLSGSAGPALAQSPVPAGPSSAVTPAEAGELKRLLEQGNSKSALELAKQIHKRAGTLASEALLVGAYVARIRSMADRKLILEAKALLDMVWERYPASRAGLEQIRIVLATHEGSFEDLLRPLGDPALPKEKRSAIEDVVRRELTDLTGLAQCQSIPPEHPLRRGAAALQKAFVAVTSGPVEEGALALPEISYRSPLAPWKMLVQAVAAFYRRDDSACERYLQAIHPDSSPARFIPVLGVLLKGQSGRELKPAACSLVTEIGGNLETLRESLQRLDAAFFGKNKGLAIQELRNTLPLCRQTCPDLLERLKQHISIRAMSLDFRAEQVRAAMGGPARKDAYFWRLFARTAEEEHEALSIPACSLWEQFRMHAVYEGWFPEDGPEAAVLYLHMADLLQMAPEEFLDQARRTFMADFAGYGDYYSDQPASVQAAIYGKEQPDPYFLYPERLFERAGRADPHPEVFEQWLNWAKQKAGWKPADEAAEAWHQAVPDDSRPLLFLMESAEKRGALKKAVGFLEKAEGLDGLNSEVRRARLRLLVNAAIRHLNQRKPHLAERELADLGSLEQAQEQDRPAFLAALRWGCGVIRGDREEASRQFAQASRTFDCPLAVLLTFSGVAEACEITPKEAQPYLPEKLVLSQTDSYAAAVGRACGLGDDMGLIFGIPEAWEAEILDDLQKNPGSLTPPQLRALAESALRVGRQRLAYAASSAGLARGGSSEAKFLLLRARALPDWEDNRRNDCIAAAAELARRQRDMDLIEEAVELRRNERNSGFRLPAWLVDPIDERDFSMSAKQLDTVLKRERKATKFPARKQSRSTRGRKLCNCPSCRLERGEISPFDEDDEEEGMGAPALEDVLEALRAQFAEAGKKPKGKKTSARTAVQGQLFEPF